jgi:hypothetical protein
MMPLDACMLLCWSSIDCEQYIGDEEYFVDDQDQQEFVEQGKYNMRSTFCPIHN